MTNRRSTTSPLDRMRIARDQREQVVLDPVVRPLRQQVSSQRAQINGLQHSLETMSSIVTSEIGPRIISDLRELILQRIEQEIYEAMRKASGRVPGELIMVPLQADMVRFSWPDEVTRQVIDKAAATYRTESRAVGSFDAEKCMTSLRVTIPKVEAEIIVGNHISTLRRRA